MNINNTKKGGDKSLTLEVKSTLSGTVTTLMEQSVECENQGMTEEAQIFKKYANKFKVILDRVRQAEQHSTLKKPTSTYQETENH